MTQAIVLWGCLCSMDKLALHCARLPQVLQTSGLVTCIAAPNPPRSWRRTEMPSMFLSAR